MYRQPLAEGLGSRSTDTDEALVSLVSQSVLQAPNTLSDTSS